MKTPIKATDGHTALLRDNEIATIGYIYEQRYRINAEGDLKPVIVVELDFEAKGLIDRFYFEEEKLVYYNLAQKPSKIVYELYREALSASKCDLNSFLVTMAHGYSAEMVYGPTTP